MRKPGKNNKTPLDAKQKALLAQQENLRQEMLRLQALIDEAPKVAEERARQRREEMVARASTSSRRFESPASLSDKRYDLHTAAMPRRRKSLKSEQRQARLKFLALCALLFMFFIFIMSKLSH